MLNIDSFLKKHQSKIKDDVLIFQSIIAIVKNKTGIILNNDDFLIKKDFILLKISPIKKNIIYLAKEKILVELKNFGIFNIK